MTDDEYIRQEPVSGYPDWACPEIFTLNKVEYLRFNGKVYVLVDDMLENLEKIRKTLKV